MANRMVVNSSVPTSFGGTISSLAMVATPSALIDRLLVGVFGGSAAVRAGRDHYRYRRHRYAVRRAVGGGVFFHGYYGHYCYLPLFIFSGQHVLCARQRVSKQDAAEGSLAELNRIAAKIRKGKRALEAEQATQDQARGRRAGDGKVASGKRPQGGVSKHQREYGEPPPKKQRDFTDPESRIMKLEQRMEQCYNAQAVVEEGHRLIVAQQVGQNAADSGELLAIVDQVERNTGSKPQRVLADAGYCNEENFAGLEERQIEGWVALGREGRVSRSQQPKVTGVATARMQRPLEEHCGQRCYARRKGLVEPVLGWLKAGLGIPAILAARAAERTRRMEFGDAGLEPAPNGRDGAAGGGELVQRDRRRVQHRPQ